MVKKKKGNSKPTELEAFSLPSFLSNWQVFLVFHKHKNTSFLYTLLAAFSIVTSYVIKIIGFALRIVFYHFMYLLLILLDIKISPL